MRRVLGGFSQMLRVLQIGVPSVTTLILRPSIILKTNTLIAYAYKAKVKIL